MKLWQTQFNTNQRSVKPPAAISKFTESFRQTCLYVRGLGQNPRFGCQHDRDAVTNWKRQMRGLGDQFMLLGIIT